MYLLYRDVKEDSITCATNASNETAMEQQIIIDIDGFETILNESLFYFSYKENPTVSYKTD